MTISTSHPIYIYMLPVIYLPSVCPSSLHLLLRCICVVRYEPRIAIVRDVALEVQAMEAERRRADADRKRQKTYGLSISFDPGRSPTPSDDEEIDLREQLRSGPDPYGPN